MGFQQQVDQLCSTPHLERNICLLLFFGSTLLNCLQWYYYHTLYIYIYMMVRTKCNFASHGYFVHQISFFFFIYLRIYKIIVFLKMNPNLWTPFFFWFFQAHIIGNTSKLELIIIIKRLSVIIYVPI